MPQGFLIKIFALESKVYHLSNRSYTQLKTTHTTGLTDTIIYIPWQTKPLWMGFLRTLERVGRKRIWYEPTQLFLAQLGISYATGLRSCPKVLSTMSPPMGNNFNKGSPIILASFLKCFTFNDYVWNVEKFCSADCYKDRFYLRFSCWLGIFAAHV